MRYLQWKYIIQHSPMAMCFVFLLVVLIPVVLCTANITINGWEYVKYWVCLLSVVIGCLTFRGGHPFADFYEYAAIGSISFDESKLTAAELYYIDRRLSKISINDGSDYSKYPFRGISYGNHGNSTIQFDTIDRRYGRSTMVLAAATKCYYQQNPYDFTSLDLPTGPNMIAYEFGAILVHILFLYLNGFSILTYLPIMISVMCIVDVLAIAPVDQARYEINRALSELNHRIVMDRGGDDKTNDAIDEITTHMKDML